MAGPLAHRLRPDRRLHLHQHPRPRPHRLGLDRRSGRCLRPLHLLHRMGLPARPQQQPVLTHAAVRHVRVRGRRRRPCRAHVDVLRLRVHVDGGRRDRESAEADPSRAAHQHGPRHRLLLHHDTRPRLRGPARRQLLHGGEEGTVDFIAVGKAIGGQFIRYGLIAAMVAGNLGLFMGYLASGSRPIYVLSKDRLFPKWAATEHKKFGTPWVAILFMAALDCLFIIGSFSVPHRHRRVLPDARLHGHHGQRRRAEEEGAAISSASTRSRSTPRGWRCSSRRRS